MSTYLDKLNDDCQLHIMTYLNTNDLLNLTRISARLSDNAFYSLRHRKTLCVNGEVVNFTSMPERHRLWSSVSQVVENLTLDCLDYLNLREVQQFRFPHVKRLAYESIEGLTFNDGQLKKFPYNFPDVRILRLNCLTTARYLWRFPKLDELYCGTYMTPSDSILRKMFFILSLRKFELIYNTYNLQMMHPMIKSIWYSNTLETICVDDWQLCCCALPRILVMPKLSLIEIYGSEYDRTIINQVVETRANDVHTLLYHSVFRCQQVHHEAWLRMPNLKQLIFVKDRVPSSTISQLKTQIHLDEFHLVRCPSPGGGALIHLLDWDGLELINLTNTEISYDFIIRFKDQIKKSLKRRRSPITIHIHQSNLTENQLMDVVDNHPMVKISTEPLNTCVSKYTNFFHVGMTSRESRNSFP